MSNTVREIIHLSINALQSRDRNAAQKLYEMDDTVDALYRRYVNEITNPQENQNKKEFLDKTLRCYISSLLILRYLERISVHPQPKIDQGKANNTDAAYVANHLIVLKH